VTFRSTYSAWRDAIVSSLHVIALENLTGISAIEAARASAFETHLRSLTSTEKERTICRNIALDVAKLGIADEVLESKMNTIWRTYANADWKQ
jgi:hypothetical protein